MIFELSFDNSLNLSCCYCSIIIMFEDLQTNRVYVNQLGGQAPEPKVLQPSRRHSTTLPFLNKAKQNTDRPAFAQCHGFSALLSYLATLSNAIIYSALNWNSPNLSMAPERLLRLLSACTAPRVFCSNTSPRGLYISQDERVPRNFHTPLASS